MVAVSTQDAPNPSAAVACRLRLRYAKRGAARFMSHRDIGRALERALRRSAVPVAYSQGFSPHPKVSWVGASPTGAASEAEYVEVGLSRVLSAGEFLAAVRPCLPSGLALLEVVPDRGGSLADRIEASFWRIELAGLDESGGIARLREAVAAVLAAGEIEIPRLTKKGWRSVDVRPLLVSLSVRASSELPGSRSPSAQVKGPESSTAETRTGQSGAEVSDLGGSCGILDAVVRQGTPTVRPDDVLSALRVVAALELPVPAKAVRLAQGRLDDASHLVDPLALDRAAGSSVVAGEQEPSRYEVE